MSLQIIEGKPGDEEKDEIPSMVGSSVVEKRFSLRGKKHTYKVFFPIGVKGEEIRRYLMGSSKEGVEIDSIFGSGEVSFRTHYADTDKGLNFTITRVGNEYHVTLRGGRM